MNKLILGIDHTETEYGQTHIEVTHEPTETVLAAICTDDEIDDLTECLIQEVTEMVNECENWLH